MPSMTLWDMLLIIMIENAEVHGEQGSRNSCETSLRPSRRLISVCNLCRRRLMWFGMG